jgi:hypothetical protein
MPKLPFRSWQWPTSAHEEGPAGEHGAILPRRLCLTHPDRKRTSPGWPDSKDTVHNADTQVKGKFSLFASA